MNATTSDSDAALDAALEMTFPASDPIAVGVAEAHAQLAVAHVVRRDLRKPSAAGGRVSRATGVLPRPR
ncbi:MAG: hypothetical protein OHK0044_05390 [Burkholderiaceae bacterium]